MTISNSPQTTPYDGLVSRYFNRRISRPLARLLSHTPVTPNVVTLVSLGVTIGSLATFALGNPIAGGLLAQAGSIIDGVDGDLARLTGRHSRFGSFFDAVVDRYADSLVLLGLTIWAASATDSSLPWIAGFAALAGSFAVTYTRARVDEAHRRMFDSGITSLASRDVRLVIVMFGALTGFGIETLITLAVLTNAVVLVRVISAWRTL